MIVYVFSGTPGGGAIPAGQSILSLVPAGLVPVAVFPPYRSNRRLPAQCVIFTESDQRSITDNGFDPDLEGRFTDFDPNQDLDQVGRVVENREDNFYSDRQGYYRKR